MIMSTIPALPIRSLPPNPMSGLPENEYDALMRASPHEPIETDVHSMAARKERLNDAIDALPVGLRSIFDACYLERVPLRTLAVSLGVSKSTIARRRDEATRRLRLMLT